MALTLAAGVAFAIPPVVGQLALDAGASVSALLGWRYALAAVVLALIARRRFRAVPWRVVVLAFALGASLYAADAAFFWAALDRTSPPFATLLHYAHLPVVIGTAALLGRERLDARRLAALVGVLAGVGLVGWGGGADAVGIALALASAGAYAGYILVSDRLLRDTDPTAFTALLTAGAATTFLLLDAATGELFSVGGGVGIVTVLTGALVGSAFAVSAFLTGIRLLGPGSGVPPRHGGGADRARAGDVRARRAPDDRAAARRRRRRRQPSCSCSSPPGFREDASPRSARFPSRAQLPSLPTLCRVARLTHRRRARGARGRGRSCPPRPPPCPAGIP